MGESVLLFIWFFVSRVYYTWHLLLGDCYRDGLFPTLR